MMRTFVSYFLTPIVALLMLTRVATAQEAQVWVQVEAQPNLATAQERIRDYSVAVEDVNGFAMGGGWYAIALGPYSRTDAEQVLQVLRAEGKIPRDSYIAFSRAYGQQFWPVGGAVIANVEPSVTTEPATPAAEPVATPVVQEPDETKAEARRSEAQLSREERKELQRMLQWAGYYNSAIDGAFGRGTRGSMSAWQSDNGFDQTGILTTRQRAELLRQYNAILDGLELQLVSDTTAGIEMRLPLGAVQFAKYEAPYAQFNASGFVNGARVLLISQPGDQKTLFGLYDIMQTLEIVPLEGDRERRKDSFVLIGENASIVSHTQVALKDGEIKGFTLIWPAGDEERRTRLLGLMQESFARLDGVMSPAAGNNEAQRIDLLSGLQIRKPRMSRSGFFVDGNGTVVTTAQAVDACTRITLEDGIAAEVIGVDAALGLAALKPAQSLAPAQVAELQRATPRLQSDVAVAGYSYGGVLGAPTLTFGKLADVAGLAGEEELARLALAALPGDTGGPVFDAGGAVMGMLLPRAEGGKQLPGDVSFALDAAAIEGFLGSVGVSPTSTDLLASMAPEDLTTKAAGLTVLVNCWD
ncbi:trypsin-like peptidase domain-containing protein [Thalassobius sp. MITS945101]|uniref:trypsin-like peptidase domain-containing protein n=1 Tax=Thalassobius sp. MITS945101 TaxID=3096994 RepID=UPI00399A7209